MPRSSKPGTKPSAGGKYARAQGDRQDGKQLDLADVTSESGFWALMQDAISMGVSVTVSLTRDLKTINVTFFHDGERYPWYIQSREDWQAMVQAIET